MLRKRWFQTSLTGVLLLLLLYVFRIQLLTAIGQYLIDEDKLEKADVVFVLGGGSYDRGNEASRILKNGLADKVVTTGGNVSSLMLILNKELTEAEIAVLNIMRNGIDSSKIQSLPIGTSTREEAYIIANYCQHNKMSKVIVVTDKFHTKRVRKVFVPVLESKNIQLILIGAPSSQYNEAEWWNYEQGLIMVNNEYMKHLYYLYKY